MIGETPGSEKISKDQPGTFLLNLDELAELRAPYLNEDKTENILKPYKKADWKNHNYKKHTPEEKQEQKPTETLTEKDVFNDAIN
jgi:S-DNA-T family DNA segregation ATPase FtsK/SpoIIIE